MKDNASGCFFLNTVYVTQIASRLSIGSPFYDKTSDGKIDPNRI